MQFFKVQIWHRKICFRVYVIALSKPLSNDSFSAETEITDLCLSWETERSLKTERSFLYFKNKRSWDLSPSLKSVFEKLFWRTTPSLPSFLGALRVWEEQPPLGEDAGVEIPLGQTVSWLTLSWEPANMMSKNRRLTTGHTSTLPLL